MAKYNLMGGKSKGKTLAEIAKIHGMTEKELKPQFLKGTKHELEHTDNVIVARQIALDHLVEFPDYYDRLDKIEKMKKGAIVETPTTYNDIVLYHEKVGNWLFSKGDFYAWLYDHDGAGAKIQSEEYDLIMFPLMGKGSPFSDKYVPPLLMVWDKSYQKKFKGSEHLLGIVKGFYDEDKNQLIIEMMTTNPKFRRKGVNAHIIKRLRDEFGISQDDVIFDKPTKQGKLFESSKKYHLGGDMSKHLAPNGKPSNLTHEQWHMVRTPEFKAWFGDWENDPNNASKVVDENGEPLVVYHGTWVENPFDVFDFDKADLGFHFGTYQQAKNRVETKMSVLHRGRKPIIKPYFLDIKTLFDASDIGEWVYPQRYIDMIVDGNIITENEAKKNGFFTAYYPNDNKTIRDFIINKHGGDVGFVYENKYEGGGQSYIALQESQIKLADGTNTKFDGKNPDIRFANGGLIAPNGKESNLTPEQYKLVRTKAFKAWFGDWENDSENSSKVVDENGEPMVVYHGTKEKFNIFDLNEFGKTDKGFFGKGFYFTQHKGTAETYASISPWDDINDSYDAKGIVLSCFLNLKNPIIVQSKIDFINASGKREIREGYDGKIIIPNTLYSPNTEFIAFEPNQIKLADGTNTTFDSKNPDIRFAHGGEIDATAQMYIDIISMNPTLEKYQKYKDILKSEYNIDFDSIYKDNEYIENANLKDIKSQSDFLDFDNWLKYAKKISMMRGFVRMDDYMMAFKYDVTDDVWKRMSEKLDFRIEKVPYIETTTSGDIARVMGNTLYYTEHADLYYLLHEIGHIYDFQNNVSGIIHNPAYSPTHYGTMNGGETFAENFAIYFINPIALKNWDKDVYDEMGNTINPKYKYELSSLVSEFIGERLAKGGLIAPNGKESNLTPEQYKLVRTKAFKDWFGDWENDPKNASKVVDENGEPLVVYRGDSSESKKGFIFKKGFNRMGFINKDRLPNQYFHYFVNNYDVARGYAQDQIEDHNDKVKRTGKGKIWGKKVTPYFLNIRNPIDITPNNPSFPTFEEFENELKNQLRKEWFERERYRNAWDYGKEVSDSDLNKIFEDKLGKDYLEDNYISKWQKEGFANGKTNKDSYQFFIEFKNMNSHSDILNKVVRSMLEKNVDGLVFLELTHWDDGFWRDSKKYESGELKYDYKRWVEKPKVFATLNSEQIKLADGTNTTFDGENPDIRYKRGGRTIAQTPAPKSDRVYGSKTNPKGSASDSELAKSIKFNDNLEKAIENKVSKYNDEHPMDKVGIQTAKAVVRRGMGAYSKSHRPTISGGAPNSRQAWGLARLNKFLLKKSGVKVKSAYIQDDDLLKYAKGGQLQADIKANAYLKPSNCTDVADVEYAFDVLRELDAKYGEDNPTLLKLWAKMLERKKYLLSKSERE